MKPHSESCAAGCSAVPSRRELSLNHGTPTEFAKAVWNALGEISVAEAQEAINRYEHEWREAK